MSKLEQIYALLGDAPAPQGGGGGARNDYAWRAAKKPSAKKKSRNAGQNAGHALKSVLSVLDVPRAAVFSAGKEIYDSVKQDDPESHIGRPEDSFSLKDFIDQTVDEKKRIYGSDVLEHAGMPGGWQRTAAGFGLDVVADPLTYVGGVGAAKSGGENVAREVVMSGERQVARKAAERAGVELSEDALREAAVGKSDEVGKLVERFADDPEILDLRRQTAEAASRARRGNVSGLSREEIDQFLTREGTQRPIAERGLSFGTKKHYVKIPGTGRGPLAKLGEAYHGGLAKLGDAYYGSTAGKALETNRALKIASRSRDPEVALEALKTQAARTTMKATSGSLANSYRTEFSRVTKKLTDEQFAAIPMAMQGDEKAIALLDKAAPKLRATLDRIVTDMQDAGLRVNRIEDYFPRDADPRAVELLRTMGLVGKDAKGGAGHSPLAAFEIARKLKPDKDGFYTFAGVEFKAKTEAEVFAKVNEIAHNEIRKIDPKLADEIGGFFSADPRKVLETYLSRASNRIAASRAATKLYNAGLGSASRELVADPDALRLIEKLREALRDVTARQAKLTSRAAEADVTRLATERAILEQRLGQLEQSLSGTPLTEGLSDAESLSLARAAHSGSMNAADDARGRLEALEAADVKRAGYRGAAARSLQEDIDRLKASLDAGADPASVERDIAALENEHQTWVTRRDQILAEAVSGGRKDVVMPAGWRYNRQLDEVVPTGEWSEVEPKVAFRNAPEIQRAAQQNTADLAEIARLRGDLANAIGTTAWADPWASIVKLANPELTDRQIVEQIATQGMPEPQVIKDTVTRIERALKQEQRRIQGELDTASKVAEKATRDGSNGLVPGALYHGTPQPLPEHAPLDRIDESASVFGNKDGSGLYTTDDQTGRVTVGTPVLSESERNRGYATSGRVGSNREVDNPHVYSYSPRDPASYLLPLDDTIDMHDIPDELADAVDGFYGTSDWHIQPPETGVFGIDETAAVDPVGAFLIDDAAEFVANVTGADKAQLIDELAQWHAGGGGAWMDEGAGWFGAVYDGLRTKLSPSTAEFADQEAYDAASNAAASLVNDYRDHLYDDYGVKGITRRGNTAGLMDKPVEHNHHIWFRPNEDLEMVGKADFSAAFAEKQAREIAREQGRYTEILRGRQAEQAEVARKERDLAKYGAEPGAVKASPNTRRAREAAEAAALQEESTARYLNDTVDEIVSRRQAHALERRQIRSLLDSGAPIPKEMRAALEQVSEDLAVAVNWGHVHEKALEIADNQLRRVAAMEQSAAEARAMIADLHREALGIRQEIGQLSGQQIERIKASFDSSVQTEIRHGIGTPQQVADWLLTNEILGTPDGIKKALGTFDKAVGWMKAWQIATPGFHFRNFLGGVFNNALAGVDSRSYLELIRAMSKSADKLKPEEAERLALVREATGMGQIGTEGARHGSELRPKPKRIVRPSTNNFWIRGSQSTGEHVESVLRGALAWDVLKKGGSLDDAVAGVAKYHFDYADLTKFEQGLKHVIPFYTWTRKNLPLQVEQITKNPKWYARMEQARAEIEKNSSPDEIVPGYFGDLMATRLPFMKGGGHIYATPDLPPRDIARFAQGPSGIRDEVLSMLTPIVKTPIEMKFDQQFFKGLPLRDDKYVQPPLPVTAIDGLAPALKTMGLLEESSDGTLLMSEKDAYLVEQFIPIIARYRRMMPKEEKYKERRLTTLLSFFGLSARTNTLGEQERYKTGQEFKEKDRKRRQRALEKAAQELGG